MKLDLHTHCKEATTARDLDGKVAELILNSVKAAGLDGIAVTEHDSSDYGYKLRDIMDELFPGEIVVIPGREIRIGLNHVVELHLPDNLVFRFIAHPGDLLKHCPEGMNCIHGLEIQNGNQFINESMAREFAFNHGLLLLSNSDAHSLVDIGCHYTDVDIGELCLRVQGGNGSL